MCGIAGWISWNKDLLNYKERMHRMTDTLVKRGPDASGFYYSHNVLLGHRRLIVVDPEGGLQPMEKSINQKKYIITYNGELYNTEDIRKELLNKGHTFKSYSDTEVVLTAYMEWKEECLDKFNGIYAFAIWDKDEKRLFAARDRAGVKPLFYCEKNGDLIFGSEIKALLASEEVKPIIDKGGINELFLLGPSRVPGSGLFKGVKELKPGCYFTYDKNGFNEKKYWVLENRHHEDSLEDTTEKVRELVIDAVKRQLVSDVPLCFFLSGGLDSSAICSIASEEYRKRGLGKIDTFSVDYVDNDKYFKAGDFQPNSDTEWIKAMSDYLGTNHREVVVNSRELYEALFEAMKAKDLPGMADIDSSLLLFCKEVKGHATVALSGECADEIFGGYPWFYRDDLYENKTFPWLRATDERAKFINPQFKVNMDANEFVKSKYEETINNIDFGQDKGIDLEKKKMMALNLDWFMITLLNRKDRMSMANSLEVRVPFSDHRIIEYLWNIPWEMKYYNDREKGLLRKALTGLLPEDVLWRKKSPYPKTYNPKYSKLVKGKLYEIVNDKKSPLLNIVDKAEIIKVLEMDSGENNKPWFGQLMANPQIFAWLIQTNMWLEHYSVEIQD